MFQSTLPTRVETMIPDFEMFSIMFQSTLPTRVETHGLPCIRISGFVSIHSTDKGRDASDMRIAR